MCGRLAQLTRHGLRGAKHRRAQTGREGGRDGEAGQGQAGHEGGIVGRDAALLGMCIHIPTPRCAIGRGESDPIAGFTGWTESDTGFTGATGPVEPAIALR
ncbi:hypothetical protein GCM10023165_43740 [Variovorax defluvii]|uniref:Uncharacterized protein n=1 Tax=Variovorax defluvii TaxID=913761 RepID=A0ABP8I8J9_9BURK